VKTNHTTLKMNGGNPNKRERGTNKRGSRTTPLTRGATQKQNEKRAWTKRANQVESTQKTLILSKNFFGAKIEKSGLGRVFVTSYKARGGWGGQKLSADWGVKKEGKAKKEKQKEGREKPKGCALKKGDRRTQGGSRK